MDTPRPLPFPPAGPAALALALAAPLAWAQATGSTGAGPMSRPTAPVAPFVPGAPRPVPAPAPAPALAPAATAAPTSAAAPAAASPAPTAPLRFRGEPVTLNFVNAEIDAVSRAMSAILRQPILVDPRVKGTITLYSETALSPDAAYRSYLASLRGLGFTVVEVEGLLKVVPEADAKLQSGTVAIGSTGRRGDQVLTQIFRLNHENANNLVPVLRPLISPNNTINATAGANALVITDYADNLARLAKIIAAMDAPSGGDVEVIPLQYAVASDLAPLVQRLGDGAATPGVPGAAGGALQVLVEPRSNSLLVKAPTPSRAASIRNLVQQLDRPLAGAGGLGNLWVVPLKNADAVKLATVLRAAFAGGAGASAGGGLTGATSTPAVSPATPMSPLQGSTPGTSSAAASPVGASPAPSTGGFVQADPSTNSLIITAPEPLYRQVRAMIDQLDSRRAQIYIESMIVEVSGGNDADFGFQWQGLIGKDGDNTGLVIGTNSSVGGPSIIQLAQTVAGAATTLPGEGLNIGLIKKFGGAYNLAAVARVLQSQANTNIVSTPNLVTLDNEEAKIIVGSNVPFITGQFTNTGTATTSPFQTIERKDVGITLRIRPQVGEGGTVRMTLFQESSSLSTATAPGTSNAGPSTDKRSIESTVMVDDGQILVLGGLIEDRYVDNKSKVPILGDIPYIGALFRSESRSKKRTNLMVFLRPIVIRDGATADRLSLDRYDQIRAFQQDNQPRATPLIPIGESPVLPPVASPAGSGAVSLPVPPAPAPAPAVPTLLPPPLSPPADPALTK
ncbi:type II secretion system secretin GspD [Piscinibacter sakaiensis]|nr:type II secretion system secretin GspD [Piscinibacter sakaiensis]